MARSILLVDDDTPIRDLYQKILTDSGYSIDTAVDGKEGLEKIKAGKYDLILLDIMMPQIDGIGVLDTLKESKIKHAPILFMTNLLNDPATKEVVEKGAIGVITKVNLDPSQLITTIESCFGSPSESQPKETTK